tara:strand:- start:1162 stop:2019 length:858 start_codon:yes stop_codon:yes gene_type:complete
MIFWIASYPKSGNTWLRALISTYYFSKDGTFNETLLKKIDQFPTRKYFLDFDYDPKIVGDTCKYWVKAQEKINLENKLKFFKTHNAFGKLNNYDFTNPQNSVGCLYIVRDPRNVLTSIKNHYELNTDKAIKWMNNEKQFVYDVEKVEKFGFSDFQFISSWSLNYKSWKVQKKIPIKVVKYEDLLNQTYSIFKEVIEFINKTAKIDEKINISKIKNTLNSTSFSKLKKKEAKHGFSEAVISQKNKKKKITFFNLGPENDWRKILNKDLKEKLNKIFKNELDELYYS